VAGTVLVIEDNADIRLLLDSVLSLSGYRVVLADGGRQALVILGDPSVHPDVAILDLQMPDLSGWEVLQAIRADPATADLPVIVCTVRDGTDDLDRGRSLRCDGYLQKPFAVDELLSELAGVLAS
jgi:two-component system copper resistance phosphate regulon response regulator CusR